MSLQPIYKAENLNPAYHLRYSWTGWPSEGTFPKLPAETFFASISPAWELDGLRLLESRWAPDMIQLSFSTKPDVAPVFVAARAKGRLQHALREAGQPCPFSRKLSLRSVGDNTTQIVTDYISRQVAKSDYVDPRFKDFLSRFTREDSAVDLSQPTATVSGRYWYNLHLVLVVSDRFPIVAEAAQTTIRDRCFVIAAKKGYAVRALSLMPDHLHLAAWQHRAISAGDRLGVSEQSGIRAWTECCVGSQLLRGNIWGIRHAGDSVACTRSQVA